MSNTHKKPDADIYYIPQFESALWLLHLDRTYKVPLIPLELAMDLMRDSFKEIN